MKTCRLRIYLAGVGGQGTLTATTLLSNTVLEQNLEVVSGEIHGMAQRGGVVESTVLIGGWNSPKICHGEADVILGFEALETLRALPYLAEAGVVLSATEFVPPPGVSAGRESLPSIEGIMAEVKKVSAKSWFLPIRALGRAAGATQSGNTALLAAFCRTGLLPFGPEALKGSIRKHLPAKVQDTNLRAVDLGVEAFDQIKL